MDFLTAQVIFLHPNATWINNLSLIIFFIFVPVLIPHWSRWQKMEEDTSATTAAITTAAEN